MTDYLKSLLASPSGPNPIVQILEAYNNSPESGEPIRVLAEHFRHNQKYELADLFASLYHTRFSHTRDYDPHLTAAEQSISGFYFPDQKRKNRGHELSEFLSLSPGTDANRRQMGRNNLYWYAKCIEDYVPISFKQLNIITNDGYIPLNPSITKWQDSLWMIQRTVNYVLTEEGQYVPVVDNNIRTKNWLCKLDNEFNIIEQYQIQHPDDWPEPLYGLVLGFEDSRLFVHNNELWTSSTVRELRQDGCAQIVLAKLEINNDTNIVKYSNWKAVKPNFDGILRYEKNWMPIVDQSEISWVYSSDPLRIINSEGTTTSVSGHIIAADHWRGGSQVIPWNNGWLYVIHETIIPSYKNRSYLHRFVWLDSEFKIKKISNAMYLKTCGIEFVSGIVSHDDSIILSFGHLDKESWLATINSKDLWDMLEDVINPIDLIVDNSALILLESTNAVLLNNSQIADCREVLVEANLPLHHDTPKNWDNLLALYYCLKDTTNTDPILDVGATQESAFLPSLWRCGYKDVVSLNLSQTNDQVINGVLYRNGDITKTDYPDDHFGFVACLSVIEHGIDQEKFFKEVYRILKPGAKLFISTDYWTDPVNTTGIKLFDADMVIFGPDDMSKMILIAESVGFKLLGKFKPESRDPVIHNMGVNYTFANILLEKVKGQ